MKKWSLVFFLPLLSSAQIIRIALNWKAEPQFGGFYQASIDDKNIQPIEGGSGTPTIQMLAHGQIDYAIVSAEEILISNEQNPQKQVVAVFATFQTNPQVWITPQNRGLKSIAEILKTPGIVAAQNGLTYVQYLKKKYPDNKVKWAPYSGGITGLMREKNYTQQGFLTSEPLLAEKQGVAVSSFLIADEGFNPYTTVLAVRKSDLSRKKSEIKKVVAAVRKGWQEYLSNPGPANDLMSKINRSMDSSTFIKSAQAQKPLIETKNVGEMSAERWYRLSEALVDLKVLKGPLKASDQYQNLE